MLTSIDVLDLINIRENGIIEYRIAKRIFENGTFLNELYHRSSLYPGQNTTDHPAQVAAIAAVVWTPEVIAAFQQQMQDA